MTFWAAVFILNYNPDGLQPILDFFLRSFDDHLRKFLVNYWKQLFWFKTLNDGKKFPILHKFQCKT